MLDAFKNMSGNRGKAVNKQTSELELLIATAREERTAISAMLTALTTRSAKLMPLTNAMEQAEARATDITARLDAIVDRLDKLHDRTRLRSRYPHPGADGGGMQAEQTTQKTIGPTGRAKHVKRCSSSSQALQTQSTLDTLKKERATLEEVRASDAHSRRRAGRPGRRSADLDRRGMSSSLAQDYAWAHLGRRARSDHHCHGDGQGSRDQAAVPARCRS